jgi:hypothetical protein
MKPVQKYKGELLKIGAHLFIYIASREVGHPSERKWD